MVEWVRMGGRDRGERLMAIAAAAIAEVPLAGQSGTQQPTTTTRTPTRRRTIAVASAVLAPEPR